MDDEPLDPRYWGALLLDSFDEDDGEGPPDASTLSIDKVSWMLRQMRGLAMEVAEYDELHMAEVRRLDERRETMVGALVRRHGELEATLRQFMLARYRTFGKHSTVATPNGVLRASRPLVIELDIRDDLAAKWVRGLHPVLVVDKPVVAKAGLRELLRVYEVEAGSFVRAVDKGGGRVVRIPVGEEWAGKFEPGWVGVWLDVSDEQNVTELPGVTWAPVGEDGCGRTFTVQAA